jgi:urease accessory protein
LLRIGGIVGSVTDPDLAETLHRLGHAGRVETLTLARADIRRHRLRAVTDRGTECAIALPRDEHLADGAVLLVEPDRAIVVRMAEQRWLPLRPRDQAAAIELGYHAGNLHWRVRFKGGTLEVALEGPEQAYRDRLAPLLADGRVTIGDHG